MLANTTGVIIWQYINILKQHTVHLKLTQCYVNCTSIENKLYTCILKELSP